MRTPPLTCLGSKSGGCRVRDVVARAEARAAEGRRRASEERGRASGARTAAVTRSLDRFEQTAGGAIEREPRVLPGRSLTESCQSLHVAPDRTRIRLVLLRQSVGVERVLARQLESLRRRLDHRLAGRS